MKSPNRKPRLFCWGKDILSAAGFVDDFSFGRCSAERETPSNHAKKWVGVPVHCGRDNRNEQMRNENPAQNRPESE